MTLFKLFYPNKNYISIFNNRNIKLFKNQIIDLFLHIYLKF